MLLLIIYEFFFFHLPSGESDVIAGLDISDLSSIVAIVNNIIIKPLEFDYSVISIPPFKYISIKSMSVQNVVDKLDLLHSVGLY